MKFMALFLLVSTSLFSSEHTLRADVAFKGVRFSLCVSGDDHEITRALFQDSLRLLIALRNRSVSPRSISIEKNTASEIHRSGAICEGLNNIAGLPDRGFPALAKSPSPDLSRVSRRSGNGLLESRLVHSCSSDDTDDQDFPEARDSVADELIDDSPVGPMDPQ